MKSISQEANDLFVMRLDDGGSPVAPAMDLINSPLAGFNKFISYDCAGVTQG